jgi:hypothetical protein
MVVYLLLYNILHMYMYLYVMYYNVLTLIVLATHTPNKHKLQLDFNTLHII